MAEVNTDSLLANPVVLDAEFAALIPPLRDDEYAILEESLLREGCREPLTTWAETGILVDGHNRHVLCCRHGISYQVRSISFATRDDAKLWAIENQLGRRNVKRIDRIALALKRAPLLKQRAAENRGARTDLLPNLATSVEPVRTRETCAEVAGVSHGTFDEGKRVIEQGVPELLQAVREGGASIHAAAEVAALPPEHQLAVVADGSIKETAKALSSRRKSSGDNEWYTPKRFVDAARQVLGEIDLDPASCPVAQRTVCAGAYFTKDDDGLSKPWSGRLWVNPPFARTLIVPFVQKLVDEFAAGNVTAAILLTNSETASKWFQLALSKATLACFATPRLRFLRSDTSCPTGAPQLGQTFFYFGSDDDRFAEVFGALGGVVRTVNVVATTAEVA